MEFWVQHRPKDDCEPKARGRGVGGETKPEAKSYPQANVTRLVNVWLGIVKRLGGVGTTRLGHAVLR